MKRPLSAYNIFFSEERARLKEESVSKGETPMTFAEMGKVVAQRWAGLTQEEKQNLQQRAEQKRQRYFHDMSDLSLEKVAIGSGHTSFLQG